MLEFQRRIFPVIPIGYIRAANGSDSEWIRPYPYPILYLTNIIKLYLYPNCLNNCDFGLDFGYPEKIGNCMDVITIPSAVFLNPCLSSPKSPILYSLIAMLDEARHHLFSYVVGVNFCHCDIVVVVPMGAAMHQKRTVMKSRVYIFLGF